MVPLVALSGGLDVYLAASRRLGSTIMGLTSVFAHGLPAAAGNLQYILLALVSAHGVGLAFFVPLLLGRARLPWALSPVERRLLLLWTGPAALFFVLVHVGQAGYLLLLLPATMLLQAAAIFVLAAQLTVLLRRAACHRWLSSLLGAASGFRMAAAARAAQYLPELLAALAALGGAAVFLWSANDLSAAGLAENDRFWTAVQRMQPQYPPETTVLLTGMLSGESFRHAFYYLPAYQIYGVGPDIDGDVGILFEGHAGTTDYVQFLGGRPARRTVALPQNVRTIIYLDGSLGRLMEPERQLERRRLTAKRSIFIYTAAGPIDALHFRRPMEPRDHQRDG
jgi:hypothetical protein